jgi:hypothetical protein
LNRLQPRLLALGIVVIFCAITYVNWRQSIPDGRYSMRMAVFGPAGVVGGIFLLLYPDKFGKPETTRDKVIVLSVFGIGVLAGLCNWYLMDPGYFGR